MDRSRFEHLLEAYGADFARWPANERAAGAAYAGEHVEDLALVLREARALDAALEAARGSAPDVAALSARVLAAAPKPAQGYDRRAGWALAACAVFGVMLGFGGGLMAPASAADDEYFIMAFEAPFPGDGG
jgi:hypothetical protein